ncbi:MAG: hypothetical protein KJ576_09365, partial [Proteobacteria bacterium]|nr:hypothetical protein [Pseudomonadota bacterium]
MRKKNLKVIIAEAAEIAKTVPENLQEAAFHRVMDELLGKSLGSKIEAPEKKREATKPKRGFSHNPANLDGTLSILNDIDSTKYPEIQKMPKAIDKSLKVLQLARVDHETDGLTA